MAARFTVLGSQVSESPALAHVFLVELFSRCDYSATAVAREVAVDVVTLRRWITKLVALGYSDPRGDNRALRGPDRAPRAPRPDQIAKAKQAKAKQAKAKAPKPSKAKQAKQAKPRTPR